MFMDAAIARSKIHEHILHIANRSQASPETRCHRGTAAGRNAFITRVLPASPIWPCCLPSGGLQLPVRHAAAKLQEIMDGCPRGGPKPRAYGVSLSPPQSTHSSAKASVWPPSLGRAVCCWLGSQDRPAPSEVPDSSREPAVTLARGCCCGGCGGGGQGCIVRNTYSTYDTYCTYCISFSEANT